MRILKMENRDNSLFYCNIEKNQHNQNFIDKLQEYSDINSKQVYVVSKALGTENEYTYEISDIAIISAKAWKRTMTRRWNTSGPLPRWVSQMPCS